MKKIKLLSIILAIGLLAGCATDVSTEAKQQGTKPIPQSCNQWCHNGWCSTHCDNVVNTTN